MKEVIHKTKITVEQNRLDKVISFFSPVRAKNRLKARVSMALFNAYDGASKSRRALKEFNPFGGDADSDTLTDLPSLRERSRDLVRNNPLATGAIKTKITNVVGTGLRLQSRIDRDVINISDDQADAWESKTEREWRLFWNSKDCDVARTLNGLSITRMVYRQEKENGDVFILLPKITREGMPYDLKLQVVEADRVCNKDNGSDTETLSGGIVKDEYGAPVKYQILKHHPGNLLLMSQAEWDEIEAFGEKTGLRNIIHFYNPTRPGQSRGIPDLAPVIESLKQLGRYTEAEIMAAVISAYFTVFVETDGGDGDDFDYTKLGDEVGHESSDKDKKLGPGLIVGLGKGEKIHDSNPGRPNQAFDQFVLSVLRQIGVALELPFEILIKHFTASYSAARAALLELWKFVMSERKHLVDNFLKIVFEIWMYEAVANGRIAAPGFFTDPAIRAAYLGCDFIGPSKGQINELNEVKAAGERVDLGLSDLARETAELTGEDWETTHKQQVKEHKKRLDDGLIQPPEPPGVKANGK